MAVAAAVAVAASVAAGRPAAGTGGVRADPPARIAIADTKPPWAVANADEGPLASTFPVSARVYFAGHDPGGLARYIAWAADPRGTAYARYLTAAQALRRFGPTAPQTAAVTRWRRAAGLTVTATTPSGRTSPGGSCPARSKLARAAGNPGTAYREFPVSGTSMSCPLFAGIQALAQQALSRPLGFANPELYARYRTRVTPS